MILSDYIRAFLPPLLSAIISVTISILYSNHTYLRRDLVKKTPTIIVCRYYNNATLKTIFRNSDYYKVVKNENKNTGGLDRPFLKFNRIEDIDHYSLQHSYWVMIRNDSEQVVVITYFIDKKSVDLTLNNFQRSYLDKGEHIVFIFPIKEKPLKIILQSKNMRMEYNLTDTEQGEITPTIFLSETKHNQ